jgi:hypothetical protein
VEHTETQVEGQKEGSTRRHFLKQAGLLGAAVAVGNFAAIGTGAFAATGGETVASIIAAALTAERLATTFYYTGLHSPIGAVVNSSNKPYLQGALGAEYYHVQLLTGAGATSPYEQFYFPSGTFSTGGNFLNVLEALEVTFIKAYLAAVYQFGGPLKQPALAQLAAEIMGVEAEHRVLGHQIAGLNVPNDFYLEWADGTSVANVATALTPFVTGKFAGGSVGPYKMPTQGQVTAAVGQNAGWNPNTTKTLTKFQNHNG